MISVFLLYHTHHLPDGEQDDKLLGVYSSREKAENKIAGKYRLLPGFSEQDGEFTINEYFIDKDNWEEGFVLVKNT
ncbi:MAG: hypothetical protein AB7D06_17855 [Pedobacter sp.]